MAYINKIKKGNNIYDIHDKRLDDGNIVTTIGGASGAIKVGDGLVMSGDTLSAIGGSSSTTTFVAIEPLEQIFDYIYHKWDLNTNIDPQRIWLNFSNNTDTGVWHYITDILPNFSDQDELVKVKIIILSGDEDGEYLKDDFSSNRPIILSNFTTTSSGATVCDFEFFGDAGYSYESGEGWTVSGAIKGLASFDADAALNITFGWSTVEFTSWIPPEAP